MKLNTSKKPYKPKAIKFPPDFILVIDTREQAPLFTRTKGLVSVVDTVKHGDYTIRGFEDRFAIERKQISDFYSYIGRERNRTVVKLNSLSQFDFAGLVIEADWTDILQHQLFSRVHPSVAEGFLCSVNIRYGIHVFAHRDRGQIERWVLKRAVKYYNLQREVDS